MKNTYPQFELYPLVKDCQRSIIKVLPTSLNKCTGYLPFYGSNCGLKGAAILHNWLPCAIQSCGQQALAVPFCIFTATENDYEKCPRQATTREGLHTSREGIVFYRDGGTQKEKRYRNRRKSLFGDCSSAQRLGKGTKKSHQKVSVIDFHYSPAPVFNTTDNLTMARRFFGTVI